MENTNFQHNTMPEIDIPKLYHYEIPGQRKNLLFIEKVTTMHNLLNGLNWQRMACQVKQAHRLLDLKMHTFYLFDSTFLNKKIKPIYTYHTCTANVYKNTVDKNLHYVSCICTSNAS